MLRSPIVCLIATSLVALTGCGRGGGAPAGLTPERSTASWATIPESALLYYDNGAGVQDSLREVVRDAATLNQIWRRATSSQSSPPPVPTVNFEREMVVVAATGRMTPNDMIRVDSTATREEVSGTRRQRIMEVVVHTVRGCGSLTTDAYPVAIVRVPRFEGDVRFLERREQAEGCQ